MGNESEAASADGDVTPIGHMDAAPRGGAHAREGSGVNLHLKQAQACERARGPRA